MSPRLQLASAQTCVSRTLDDDATIVISEFAISHHQSFRAEIIVRDGQRIVSISRWKSTAAGPRRTGQSFEFGAHRTAGIAKILADVQRVLATLNTGGSA
jgi:hypothetical protein